MLKIIKITFFFFFLPVSVFSFTDESHYSTTFGMTRQFRVFTPINYNPENTTKRYPVIYYFHGCGGSYDRSGPYSYADYGLEIPALINRTYHPSFEYANNVDFENVSDSHNVIIVSVDGKIEGLEGCGVFFPSLAESWSEGYYNFSVYIRELIEVVDERYNTRTGPQHRAISGLSMGGYSAIWIAAANPHLFSSASQFCHSPNFYDIGDPSFQTTVDVKELWRNLRGLPFRHTTTDRDYIRFYTDELSALYSGAGFENEYYLADLCHHAAGRVDLQFDFHMDHFSSKKEPVPCFSLINLYPDFEIRGYNVSSQKKGNGMVYLHDVTHNGLGVYTRERFPWGKSLPGFDIQVTTPPDFIPNAYYTISRYSYRNENFYCEELQTDPQGRLKITSIGGVGEEIGIIGDDLQPPVFILTDTINENIYLNEGIETPLTFDIINLSPTTQKIDFTVSTENNKLLTILAQPGKIKVPGMSKKQIKTFAVVKGDYISSFENKGYIKITSSIDGIPQEREQIIQVHVINNVSALEPSQVKIFDGKSENLSLFSYVWNEWDNPNSSGIINEGLGNGNGKVEVGEIFSIWIQPSVTYDPKDISTWHPTIPVQLEENNDVFVEEIKEHRFNTGREVLSANIRLNRIPTEDNPVRITLQSELLRVEPLENDCHRNAADNFTYSYFEITIDENGLIKVDPN